MKQKRTQYRQGDVLIERIASLPKGERKAITRGPRGYVLAEGEVTGHAHVVEADSPDVEMLDIAGVTILDVHAAVAALTHEEHSTISLPKGTYIVKRQREYTPTVIRNVAD